jgi:hypothetical protein
VSDVAAWWVYVIRYEARELWKALPGPWWVKVLLIVALNAIPGQVDDLIFLAVLSAFRKRQARKVKTSSDEEEL